MTYVRSEGEGGRGDGGVVKEHMVIGNGPLMLHKVCHSHTSLLFHQSLREPPPQVNSCQVTKWIKAD